VAAASQSRRLSDTTTVAVEFYISGTDVDAAREAIDDLVNGNEEDVTALTNVLNSALSEEFGETIEIADAQLRDPSVSVVAVQTAAPTDGPDTQTYDLDVDVQVESEGPLVAFMAQWTVLLRVLAGILVGVILFLMCSWAYFCSRSREGKKKKKNETKSEYLAVKNINTPQGSVAWHRVFTVPPNVSGENEYEV